MIWFFTKVDFPEPVVPIVHMCSSRTSFGM